jgi:hypothetical protein
MKRAMWVVAAAAAAVASAGCAPRPAEEAADAAEAASGWTRPPSIDRVTRAGTELVVVGVAEPNARVVLRSDAGAAFAASADDRGRFEIRMSAPVGHLLLRPETQVGQDAAASPDRLLIVDGGRGPVAVLRSGGPTRRLDAAPGLGAVDSDGRMRLASGQAASAAPVTVQSGGETVQVSPAADGRWRLMLAPQAGPDVIVVGGRAYAWPGEAAAPRDGLSVEAVEGGWRIGWAGSAGASQSTWLPAGR